MIRAKELVKEALLRAANMLGVPSRYRPKPERAVRILTYHRFRVGARRDSSACLDVAKFCEQLDFLRRDYDVVPLEEAVRLARTEGASSRDLARPPVAITMDDGFEDNYLIAFPELRKRGLPATAFVVARFVQAGEPPWPSELAAIVDAVETLRLNDGRTISLTCADDRDAVTRSLFQFLKCRAPKERTAFLCDLRERNDAEHVLSALRPLTRVQLREMAAGGIEIGSHSMHHSVLTNVPADIALAEIVESREAVLELTGKVCRFLAYPDGKWNPDVAAMTKAAGYEAAVSQGWGLNVGASDPFALQRIDIPYYESMAVFAARVSGLLRPLAGSDAGLPAWKAGARESETREG